MWVEILRQELYNMNNPSHPHGCVSWNLLCGVIVIYRTGHTLTGVWVEMPRYGCCMEWSIVTPSRVCELKCSCKCGNCARDKSHPHGCVSWNILLFFLLRLLLSHTLTGVWVEINEGALFLTKFPCHTLTGVWVEISFTDIINPLPTSHPHGYVLKIMTISR